MKLASLLFYGGLLSLLALHFVTDVLPKRELQRLGEDHPLVTEIVGAIRNPVDGTAGAREERPYELDAITQVRINPGFRVTHDPTLGQEVLVTTTAAAHDLLVLSSNTGRLEPFFSRPVRLTDYVDIRLNLTAHANGYLRVARYQPQLAGKALEADFATAGPLQMQLLELRSLGLDDIEVEAVDLAVAAGKGLEKLRGKAGRLEILYDSKEQPRETVPADFRAGQVLHTVTRE